MPEPTLDELSRWDREHVWHAFTQMAEYEPLLIERAAGCTLYDAAGKAYLDGVASLWCNVHGHRHPRLDAAIVAQLGRIAHTTALGASNSTTIRLTKALVDRAPTGLQHVFYASDGSSAVEVALKIAFQYWQQCQKPRPQKTCYVALGEAYHGDTVGCVSIGGVEQFHAMFAPLLFEVLRLPTPRADRLPANVNPAQAAAHYLSAAEQLLAAEHERIAAVVIEPLMQCAAGMLPHPAGYLRGLRELTTRYNVLLIADEVAVGFGRTGRLFACEHEQVTPDLLCLGKGLTGGYLPMSATMATTEVWSAFLGSYAERRQLFHGHSFSGNPLAAAVALESLAVFDDEHVLANLPAKIARLEEHLQRIASHPHVGGVRQCGLIAGIELAQNRAPLTPYPASERRGQQVCLHARDRGVLLRPLGDCLVVMPPLAISLPELDEIMVAIERGIEHVCGR